MKSVTLEYKHFIEIVPVDEIDLHISGFTCECYVECTIPHSDAKPVIRHNPDGVGDRPQVHYRRAA